MTIASLNIDSDEKHQDNNYGNKGKAHPKKGHEGPDGE
jgi:hypothetical protein